MKYKKSELTKFAKLAAYVNTSLLNAICDAEWIDGGVGNYILHGIADDEEPEVQEIVCEVAKRFAKYTKDYMLAEPQLNARTLIDAEDILRKIVDCCVENNWFRKEDY